MDFVQKNALIDLIFYCFGMTICLGLMYLTYPYIWLDDGEGFLYLIALGVLTIIAAFGLKAIWFKIKVVLLP